MTDPLLRYRDGGRSKLTEEGRCRMCLRDKAVRRLTRHHVVPQRWFNEKMRRFAQPGPFFDMDEWTRLWKLRDAEANIVPLCERCHREVEADASARRMLRKVMAAQEAAFAIKARGRSWFDRTYPPMVQGGRLLRLAS